MPCFTWSSWLDTFPRHSGTPDEGSNFMRANFQKLFHVSQCVWPRSRSHPRCVRQTPRSQYPRFVFSFWSFPTLAPLTSSSGILDWAPTSTASKIHGEAFGISQIDFWLFEVDTFDQTLWEVFTGGRWLNSAARCVLVSMSLLLFDHFGRLLEPLCPQQGSCSLLSESVTIHQRARPSLRSSHAAGECSPLIARACQKRRRSHWVTMFPFLWSTRQCISNPHVLSRTSARASRMKPFARDDTVLATEWLAICTKTTKVSRDPRLLASVGLLAQNECQCQVWRWLYSNAPS